MGGLSYDLLSRVLDRCQEQGTAADCAPAVARVWNDLLKEPAQVYLDACKAHRKAEGVWAKEATEAVDALDLLDQPYRVTRSVVSAFKPHEVLPETLKSLPTETERKNAIVSLVELLDANAAETWAQEQSAGDFGTRAPGVIQELNQSIEANKDFSKAETARAAAYGPAWEKYLSFKNVVRNAYGPKSKQYRRIHIRGAVLADEGDQGGGGEGGAGGGTPS